MTLPRTPLLFLVFNLIAAPGWATLKIQEGLTYHQHDGTQLKGDLYRVESSCQQPGVILIHGGGWTKGNRGQMKSIGRKLAKQGFVAFSVSYRLAPNHPFPAALHDVKHAVRWLRANADSYGVNEHQIATFGYSAGAHLAVLAALTGPADGLEGDSSTNAASSQVQAAVGGGTPTDLTLFSENASTNALLGGPKDEYPDLYRLASPVHYVSPEDPPVFLYHGKSDAVVRFKHAEVLTHELKQAGVPVSLFPGRFGHIYRFLFGGKDVAAAGDFLKRHLKPEC